MFISSWKSLVGESFGDNYLLRELLDHGTFGGVFLAEVLENILPVKNVAIKLIIIDEDSIEEQIKELEIATKLKHKNLINCYQYQQKSICGVDFLGLIMEVADYSLDCHLKKVNIKSLSVNQKEIIIESILASLSLIHAHGIVHCDLKPGNILKVDNLWKLTDFGIARSLNSRTSTKTSISQGTYRYMPPEAFEGIISSQRDIWSLGVLITELLTGEHPFPHNNEWELLWKIRHEEPIIPEDISIIYSNIIKGCLVKNRNKRWNIQKIISYFDLAKLDQDSTLVINKFIEERLNEIESLQQEDNYQEIISLCDVILAIKENYFEAWHIKGDSFSCLGKYPESLYCYEQVLRLKPDNLEVLNAKEHVIKKIT